MESLRHRDARVVLLFPSRECVMSVRSLGAHLQKSAALYDNVQHRPVRADEIVHCIYVCGGMKQVYCSAVQSL